MAVISVDLDRQGSTSKLTLATRQSTLTWIVITAQTDSSVIAEQASGIPAYGTPHPDDPFRYCIDVSADRVEPGVFRVTATYETPPNGEQQLPDNPLNQVPQYQWGFNTFERAIDYDLNGIAIVNSAGEPYDPGVMMKYAVATLNVTRNEPAYDHSYAFTFVNHVNADTFYGVGPGYAFCTGISGSSATFNILGLTQVYWVVNYQIEFSSFPYQPKVLDAGYKEWYSPLTRPVNIKDDYGNDVSRPVMLDGTGHKAAQGYNGYWRDHPVYGQANFYSLGI